MAQITIVSHYAKHKCLYNFVGVNYFIVQLFADSSKSVEYG